MDRNHMIGDTMFLIFIAFVLIFTCLLYWLNKPEKKRKEEHRKEPHVIPQKKVRERKSRQPGLERLKIPKPELPTEVPKNPPTAGPEAPP